MPPSEAVALMPRRYCTLFDSRYLPQGLALYESLVKHLGEGDAFTLYVLPMDAECERKLRAMALSSMWVVDPAEFESYKGMSDAKHDRSYQEYCWTCASNLTDYLMAFLPEITYLDADMFFFSDPEVIFKEIGNRQIAITPHRLIPSKRHLEVNGAFNVGLVYFKTAYFGQDCLSQWADDCRRRCSATDGCGDQKYLDVWPGKYAEHCCIIQNIGVNAGPWSLANWEVTEGPCLDGVPLVAYHFHEYIHGQRLTNYVLRQSDIDLIYKPYIAAVGAARKRLEALAAPVSG